MAVAILAALGTVVTASGQIARPTTLGYRVWSSRWGKDLEAHGYGRFEDGRPLVELQQHLLHFLHGTPDVRCTGERMDGVR